MNTRYTPRGPEEGSVHQLKPIKMPWLHLLDPITGEYPKNFQEILAKEKEPKNKTSVEKFQLKRLPPSAFLDPDAGKPISFDNEASTVKKWIGKPKTSNRSSHLFSNRMLTSVNQSKSQQSFGVNKCSRPSTSSARKGSSKQRKKSSDFEVSKSNSGTFSTTTGQHTMQKTVVETEGVRKRLFMEAPKPKESRLPTAKTAEPFVKNHGCVINILEATPPCNDDTVALLEMSVAESLITNGVESTSESLEPLTLDVDVNSPKNECSSGSSISEFLQLEQECRTPKQKKSLAESACYCDRSDYYIEKFSNITEKLSELLEESKDVLEHLKNCKAMNKAGSNKKQRSSINKENVQSVTTKSILTSAKKKKKDLRVDTLKKNVTFNVRNKRDNNALNLYNSVRNNILRTPKVSNNANSNPPLQHIDNLSKRVQDQCLLLQQTPK